MKFILTAVIILFLFCDIAFGYKKCDWGWVEGYLNNPMQYDVITIGPQERECIRQYLQYKNENKSTSSSSNSIKEENVSPQKSDSMVLVSDGLLSESLKKILLDNGWNILPNWWQASNDYRILQPYYVTGDNIYDIVSKILENYRLRANFYEFDRVVIITELLNR